MLVSRLVSRFQQDTSPIHLCPYTTFDRNSDDTKSIDEDENLWDLQPISNIEIANGEDK